MSKYTVILYYYCMFSVTRGLCLHFKTSVRQRKPGYLFHPYIDLKIRNHIKNTQNHFDNHFDKPPTKSSISPIFTTPKITIIPPKYLSNPYKLRFQSNSAKNHTQSTKFHLTNHQKSNIKIIQNTSKINTFQLHQTHKQHCSIEVIFFYNQIRIKTHIKNNTHIISK